MLHVTYVHARTHACTHTTPHTHTDTHTQTQTHRHTDTHTHKHTHTHTHTHRQSPLSELDNTKESMTFNILSQLAVVSTSSHFSNISLQHHLTLSEYPASISSSRLLDSPNSSPITFHLVAYCEVMCW